MFVTPYAVRLLAVSATLLLASCIDGREEYWLNADGSGRMDVSYSCPAAAAMLHGGAEEVDKLISDFLQHIPQLKSPVLEVKTVSDRMNVRLTASFDSVLDLLKISKDESLKSLPNAASGLTGDTTLSIHGLNAEFSRTINCGEALPGSFFMPDSQFAGYQLTYIAHLPVVASASNATSVQDGGKTLVWDFPLTQAIRKPVTLSFKAPIPIPTWIVAITVVILVIASLLFVIALRKLLSMRREPIT